MPQTDNSSSNSDSVCALALQGILLALPYLLQFLVVLPIFPRFLACLVIVQLVAVALVAVSEALKDGEGDNVSKLKRSSALALMYLDAATVAAVVGFSVAFAVKFGRSPIGAVVAGAGVVLLGAAIGECRF